MLLRTLRKERKRVREKRRCNDVCICDGVVVVCEYIYLECDG